jgi:16S rRNA (adenine1518-N6/adenine1519-N6)-dimethyltransferase
MKEKISTPSQTRRIMEQHGFFLKKKFGQNFLIDQNILEGIVRGANLTKDDVVIEIGPGIGSLTQYLAESAKEVVAIEIDKSLIPILTETLKEYDNVSIVNQDVLKVDLNQLIQERWGGKPVKVVANLPYYITTPIIMSLFESHIPLHSITVMIQKEVADRMQAKPSTKDYGALSLAVQYYSEPKIVLDVPPSCFIPQPNVGSAVICLTYSDKYMSEDRSDKLLFEVIRGAFQQRRKTLVNTLAHQGNLNVSKDIIFKALETMELSPTIRGEALSLEQFIQLTAILKTLI